MSRKKKVNIKVQDPEADIQSANPGDYCYYLDRSNKIHFAEITKTFLDNKMLCFEMICQAEYKFKAIQSYFCSFSEKSLKGKKRSLILLEMSECKNE